MDKCEFKAFVRPDGSLGIRNHLAIISTVACANYVAEKIACQIPSAVVCTHPYGCDQLGRDAELTLKVLYKIGCHPNVGGVLVVGLGCEEIIPADLAADLGKSGRPIKMLVIQESGGTTQSIIKGVEFCRQLQREMDEGCSYTMGNLSSLIIGLECGGSDFTSGIAANPSVGVAADLLVAHGAKVVFGETTEMLGAEHILFQRTASPEIRNFIIGKVAGVEEAARQMMVDIRGAQPSPGNIAGGLSSIEEKSLGAICKAGSSPIVDALEFADKPPKSGLSFMDTPGNDLACTCGLVAGGAQIVVFTTGRGTPMGFAIAPVIKITANAKTARKMEENIDLDLSGILANQFSVEDAGIKIVEYILRVACGKMVQAELLGHREFGFHRIGPTL